MIFSIVKMKLFELYMFELDININCRHLLNVFLLVRIICNIVYEIADNDFLECV